MKTFKSEWENFRRQVINPNAPEIQISEMQMSYYAGALSLLTLLMNALDPSKEPTNKDLELMDNIHTEIYKFLENRIPGKIQ